MGFLDSLKQGVSAAFGGADFGQALGTAIGTFGAQLLGGGGSGTMPVPRTPPFVPVPPFIVQEAQRFGVPGAGLPRGLPAPSPITALPGGAQVAAFPTTRGTGFAEPVALDPRELPDPFRLPGIDVVPEGIGAATRGISGFIGTPLRRTMAGVRAAPFAVVVDGRQIHFRPAGRPVLFSGDFAACRRVDRVARRARRRRPR